MNISEKIKSINSNSLSKFKTFHQFESYGEIRTIEEYISFAEWARINNKEIFILGNGSNTLFARKKIKSLILKNSITKDIKNISPEENLFEISSTVMVSEVLNFCLKSSLNSFYFLASVPATIGGALAMNAGQGQLADGAIFDFVESVTYIDSDNLVKKIERKDMDVGYRKTMFTGCQDKFIVSAVFKFPKKKFKETNPIKSRVNWAKENQDNIAPNCGSVFKKQNGRIMSWLKGFKLGKAQYSIKTKNWINNNSNSSLPILSLIFTARVLHKIFRKRCEVEIIRVK